ncbi:hypothetical protein TNCT_386341 [Trichonephila clavata]|uniref:Uncharacterized protein n=1 Tax=Trichonephila clavata TaxID=2740835 RepID=A0A8X6H8S4_TRICU|nr:hypothetical protein TNCT_386341 [Trichonephila clavata]
MSKRGGQKKVWIAGRVRRLPCGPESVRWQALRARAENFLERERERIQRDSEPEEPSDVNGKQTVSKRLRGPAETRGRFAELCELTQFLLDIRSHGCRNGPDSGCDNLYLTLRKCKKEEIPSQIEVTTHL